MHNWFGRLFWWRPQLFRWILRPNRPFGRRSEAELTVLSSFLLGFEAKLSFRWIWPNRRFGRPFCSEAEAAAFLLEAFFSLFEGRIVCLLVWSFGVRIGFVFFAGYEGQIGDFIVFLAEF